MYHRDPTGTLAVTSSTGEFLTPPHPMHITYTQCYVVHSTDEKHKNRVGPLFLQRVTFSRLWNLLKTAGQWVGCLYGQGKYAIENQRFIQSIKTDRW